MATMKTYKVSGRTYGIREKLKELGWHWDNLDSDKSQWSIATTDRGSAVKPLEEMGFTAVECEQTLRPLADEAWKLMNKFPGFLDTPTSLSGKHHSGETHREHAQLCQTIMEHLCREFDITGDQEDLLTAATILHDIGLTTISRKGEVPGWHYFKATGYSRDDTLYFAHGSLVPAVLYKNKFSKAAEVGRLCASHMSHWQKASPQPETFEQKLVCIADYMATWGPKIFGVSDDSKSDKK